MAKIEPIGVVCLWVFFFFWIMICVYMASDISFPLCLFSFVMNLFKF